MNKTIHFYATFPYIKIDVEKSPRYSI